MDDTVKAKSEQRRQFMLEGPLGKVIFITAIPQVITMLVDSLYNMADTFFVSQLGSAATAAVGVNNSLMMVIRAIAMGFGIGSSSYISRALGAKKDEEASRAATTTLITAMAIIFLLVTVIGSIFISPIVDILGATATVKPHSMEYARWIMLSAPITGVTVCLSQTLRAEGNTRLAMVGTVSGCVINVVLDPIFISVLGYGVAGAAIATGISKCISALVLLSPYIKKQCVIMLKPSYFTPKMEIYGEIAKMGVPTMIRTSMMSVSAIVLNNVAAGFGDTALAAVSVADKSLKLVSSAIMGFGQGFQPVAGYSWGAKKYDRVLKSFKLISVIGSSIAVVLGFFLFLFAVPVMQIFSTEPDVVALGRILIRSQCVVLVPHMMVMIVTGLFQALGKPVQAGVLGLSRQLISLIPCVILLSYLFGVNGLAVAQATADVISCTISVILVIPMVRRIGVLAREQAAGPKASSSYESAVAGNE